MLNTLVSDLVVPNTSQAHLWRLSSTTAYDMPILAWRVRRFSSQPDDEPPVINPITFTARLTDEIDLVISDGRAYDLSSIDGDEWDDIAEARRECQQRLIDAAR